MIEIMNLKTSTMYNPWDIRVDRATVYGNPYYMGEFDGQDKRTQCIAKYREYFHKEVNNKRSRIYKGMQRVLAIYAKHGKLRLFCHCVPMSCHAEVIKHYLIGMIEKYKKDNPKLIEGI